MGHWEEVKNNFSIFTLDDWYYQFRQRLMRKDDLKRRKMKRFILNF